MDTRATAPTAAAGEIAHAPGYLAHLLFFICFATLFEGYDLLIINLALPSIGVEFAADSRTLGFAVGIINIGTIAAFFPVRLADRYGRRPVFLLAVTGYTLFTVLTVFASGLGEFVVCQFIARLFMVTEIGVGAIILTEEMPARFRGAAVTLMFALSLLGGVVGSSLYPLLAEQGLGWRTLYLLGGVLLPVLLLYWRRLQETQRWRALDHAAAMRSSLLASFKELRLLLASRYRRRLLAGASIWFTVNAWSSSCLFFFAYYVTNERGWTAAEVGYTLTIGYSLAVIGYATAGPMLDFAGRRLTACMYFTLGGLAAMTCFLAESAGLITVAYIVVLGMHALWPIAATITSEIFPTHMRGMANGVVNNLLGRSGMVLAPAVVGALSAWLGSVGQAVAMVAIIPFLCLPIILILVTETRGKRLEEIA